VSSLTDFLHKLADAVGVSSLHSDIDDLDNDDTTGEEETDNAEE
jgi:hypothetical protein